MKILFLERHPSLPHPSRRIEKLHFGKLLNWEIVSASTHKVDKKEKHTLLPTSSHPSAEKSSSFVREFFKSFPPEKKNYNKSSSSPG